MIDTINGMLIVFKYCASVKQHKFAEFITDRGNVLGRFFQIEILFSRTKLIYI